MIHQITKDALRAMSNLGKMKVRGLPRAFIIILMLLLVFTIIFYLTGCGFVWWKMMTPPLMEINQLINTLTSVSFIAAIGFIGKAMVDDDGDGTPNIWEENKSARSELEATKRDGRDCPELHLGESQRTRT